MPGGQRQPARQQRWHGDDGPVGPQQAATGPHPHIPVGPVDLGHRGAEHHPIAQAVGHAFGDLLGAEDISLSASVGWVIHPDDAQSVDDLIAAADFCLRGAKLTGKDRALSTLDWAPDIAA